MSTRKCLLPKRYSRYQAGSFVGPNNGCGIDHLVHVVHSMAQEKIPDRAPFEEPACSSFSASSSAFGRRTVTSNDCAEGNSHALTCSPDRNGDDQLTGRRI